MDISTPRNMSFPETLVGIVTFAAASSSGTRLHRMTVSLQWLIDDLDRFMADPQHRLRVTGFVRCEPLGGKLPITSGHVNLFSTTSDGHTTMEYLLEFEANGEPLTLRGHKQVVHNQAFDMWPDTTTLQVEVSQRDTRQTVVEGVLRFTLPQLIRSLAGMRANGRPGAAANTLVAFFRFFLARLASVYLAPVQALGSKADLTRSGDHVAAGRPLRNNDRSGSRPESL